MELNKNQTMLFINKSKIHFESKSQLFLLNNSISFGLFINKSKIHFESKSQPDGGNGGGVASCLSISQRYILKANHNIIPPPLIVSLVVYQ